MGGRAQSERGGAQKGRGVYRAQRDRRIFVPVSPWLLPSKQVMKGEVVRGGGGRRGWQREKRRGHAERNGYNLFYLIF